MATCASDSFSKSTPKQAAISRRSSVETISGHTCFLVHEPDTSFCCPICARVLRLPQLTDCCGNHFCSPCLARWLETSSSCPLCRQVDFKSIKDKKMERALQEKEVYCHFEQSGCSWSGKLCSMDTHLANDCPLVLLECTNTCGDVLQRQELLFHLQHTCSLRLVSCEYCRTEGTHRQISDEHTLTCPKVPLICPNECSTAKVLREEIPHHLNECALEPVSCSFRSLGCAEVTPRRDLEKHIEGQQGAHLLLAVQRIWSMSESLDVCRASVEQLKGELETCQRDQASLWLLMQQTQQQTQEGAVPSPLPVQSPNEAPALMDKHLNAFVRLSSKEPFLPVMVKMENYDCHSTNHEPWFSTPFYSAPLCYKMCLCVYTNGVGLGRSTHLSVYIRLMSGEFDENLCFPLEMKLTVELLNQLIDTDHWSVDCEFSSSTPYYISYRVSRGRVRAKKGVGAAKFIPLEKLGQGTVAPNCQYLRNNSLFFSIQ